MGLVALKILVLCRSLNVVSWESGLSPSVKWVVKISPVFERCVPVIGWRSWRKEVAVFVGESALNVLHSAVEIIVSFAALVCVTYGVKLLDAVMNQLAVVRQKPHPSDTAPCCRPS